MLATLLLALASLVAWAVLTFGLGPQPGVVHLLLALGTTSWCAGGPSEPSL